MKKKKQLDLCPELQTQDNNGCKLRTTMVANSGQQWMRANSGQRFFKWWYTTDSGEAIS